MIAGPITAIVNVIPFFCFVSFSNNLQRWAKTPSNKWFLMAFDQDQNFKGENMAQYPIVRKKVENANLYTST